MSLWIYAQRGVMGNHIHDRDQQKSLHAHLSNLHNVLCKLEHQEWKNGNSHLGIILIPCGFRMKQAKCFFSLETHCARIHDNNFTTIIDIKVHTLVSWRAIHLHAKLQFEHIDEAYTFHLWDVHRKGFVYPGYVWKMLPKLKAHEAE